MNEVDPFTKELMESMGDSDLQSQGPHSPKPVKEDMSLEEYRQYMLKELKQEASSLKQNAEKILGTEVAGVWVIGSVLDSHEFKKISDIDVAFRVDIPGVEPGVNSKEARDMWQKLTGQLEVGGSVLDVGVHINKDPKGEQLSEAENTEESDMDKEMQQALIESDLQEEELPAAIKSEIETIVQKANRRVASVSLTGERDYSLLLDDGQVVKLSYKAGPTYGTWWVEFGDESYDLSKIPHRESLVQRLEIGTAEMREEDKSDGKQPPKQDERCPHCGARHIEKDICMNCRRRVRKQQRGEEVENTEDTYTSDIAVSTGIPITKHGKRAVKLPGLTQVGNRKKKRKKVKRKYERAVKEGITTGQQFITFVVRPDELEQLGTKEVWKALQEAGAVIVKLFKMPVAGVEEEFAQISINTAHDSWEAADKAELMDEVGSVSPSIQGKIQEAAKVITAAPKTVNVVTIEVDEGDCDKVVEVLISAGLQGVRKSGRPGSMSVHAYIDPPTSEVMAKSAIEEILRKHMTVEAKIEAEVKVKEEKPYVDSETPEYKLQLALRLAAQSYNQVINRLDLEFVRALKSVKSAEEKSSLSDEWSKAKEQAWLEYRSSVDQAQDEFVGGVRSESVKEEDLPMTGEKINYVCAVCGKKAISDDLPPICDKDLIEMIPAEKMEPVEEPEVRSEEEYNKDQAKEPTEESKKTEEEVVDVFGPQEAYVIETSTNAEAIRLSKYLKDLHTRVVASVPPTGTSKHVLVLMSPGEVPSDQVLVQLLAKAKEVGIVKETELKEAGDVVQKGQKVKIRDNTYTVMDVFGTPPQRKVKLWMPAWPEDEGTTMNMQQVWELVQIGHAEVLGEAEVKEQDKEIPPYVLQVHNAYLVAKEKGDTKSAERFKRQLDQYVRQYGLDPELFRESVSEEARSQTIPWTLPAEFDPSEPDVEIKFVATPDVGTLRDESGYEPAHVEIESVTSKETGEVLELSEELIQTLEAQILDGLAQEEPPTKADYVSRLEQDGEFTPLLNKFLATKQYKYERLCVERIERVLSVNEEKAKEIWKLYQPKKIKEQYRDVTMAWESIPGGVEMAFNLSTHEEVDEIAILARRWGEQFGPRDVIPRKIQDTLVVEATPAGWDEQKLVDDFVDFLKRNEVEVIG